MEIREILKHVDHTLLKQDATSADIRKICDEGIRYETASVCIPPVFVKEAASYAAGRVKICTVIGFPNGYSTAETKCFEAADAVKNGADEIDTVIPIGKAKEGRFDEIEEELRQVKKACGDKILKVIIETCMLSDEEKIALCGCVTRAGADYIKTSTGFGGGGATRHDVALFAEHVGKNVKIKAAGGISSLADAEDFLSLGADRLGTSRIVKIVKEMGL